MEPATETKAVAICTGENALVALAATAKDVKGQVNLIQHVMRDVMKEGEHYGIIPGCGNKPALLKPGAEKLMLTFRFSNDVDVVIIEMANNHREYRVKVTLFAPNGQRLGTGIGSCSTMKSKYRYRGGAIEITNTPVPSSYWDIRKEDPVKAQEMLGGKGFAAKKNDNGKWMVAKQGQKVEYDNPADHFNTCLKMAKKRGLVDAVLTSTAASDIFTQDIEEYPELHGYRQSATDAEYVILPTAEQPQQTPDPASIPATGQEEGKGNPLTADLNPPVITLEQIKELQKLVKETDSNEVSFLQYLQVETLAHIPADRFTWAKKALEAKKKATAKDNPNLIVAALASRNIPFQVDEQAGEIHATPSFQDTGAKAFLKEQGFKWNPTGKAWIKQAA